MQPRHGFVRLSGHSSSPSALIQAVLGVFIISRAVSSICIRPQVSDRSLTIAALSNVDPNRPRGGCQPRAAKGRSTVTSPDHLLGSTCFYLNNTHTLILKKNCYWLPAVPGDKRAIHHAYRSIIRMLSDPSDRRTGSAPAHAFATTTHCTQKLRAMLV